MKNILVVTGGAGFVGSKLGYELVDFEIINRGELLRIFIDKTSSIKAAYYLTRPAKGLCLNCAECVAEQGRISMV